MWHLKHGANEQKRNKLVDIEKNRLWLSRGRGREWDGLRVWG